MRKDSAETTAYGASSLYTVCTILEYLFLSSPQGRPVLLHPEDQQGGQRRLRLYRRLQERRRLAGKFLSFNTSLRCCLFFVYLLEVVNSCKKTKILIESFV